MLIRYLTIIIICAAFIIFPAHSQAQGYNIQHAPIIEDFYRQNSVQYLWLNNNGRPQQRALTLIRHLEESWEHGLNPNIYHLNAIKTYMQDPQNAAPRFFDMLVSDAFIRYMQDLTSMRVDPNAINQDLRYWRHPLPAEYLLSTAMRSTDLEDFIQSIFPSGTLYKRLRAELIRIYTAPESHQSLLSLDLGGRKYLKPGQIDEKLVPQLRAYFDLPPQDPAQAYLYDDYLVNEITLLQRKNFVTPDGIIGPQTLDILNRTPQDKLSQLIVNMHRLRWMDNSKPEKYILVNIPASTLWAVENNQVKFETPVIVGRENRPTLSFVTEVTGVRVNPTWTVPPTIKRQDYLPLLREDPLALQNKGIRIIKDGETLDPTTIDWTTFPPNELHSLQMVQSPGPTNPLGRIRILMPNRFNIYLHDTSNPEYFAEYDRTISSGCVRVKDPQKLADFILAENEKWSETYVNDLMATGRMIDIAATQRIPVYLLYLTVWLNEDGNLTYGPDIYGWDDLLINALKKDNLTIPAKENTIALNSTFILDKSQNYDKL
jgi:L,D-transpeptidase YcbB